MGQWFPEIGFESFAHEFSQPLARSFTQEFSPMEGQRPRCPYSGESSSGKTPHEEMKTPHDQTASMTGNRTPHDETHGAQCRHSGNALFTAEPAGAAGGFDSAPTVPAACFTDLRSGR